MCYDKKAQKQTFKPGDEVLVLLPIPGHPLRAGPYVVEGKVNEVDYVVHARKLQTKNGMSY